MTPFFRWGRPLAFLLVFAALAASAVGVFMIRSEVEAVRNAQNENLLWAASQYQIEYLRFLNAIESFAAGDPAVTPDNVNLRFDVLWSRAEVLRAGAVGAGLEQIPQAAEAVNFLYRQLEASEQAVVNLQAGDEETAKQVALAFAVLADDVREVSLKMLRVQTDIESRQYEALVRGSELLTVLVFATAITTLLLVGIYGADARRQRLENLKTRNLLEAARQGARARSQFLSMMSHELRTPMNGILGMIALARQPGLPQGQDQLLAEAGKSAKDMHGVLSDLLDLAGQEAAQTLQAFDNLQALVERVSADVGAGIAVRAGVEQGADEAFIADINRLTCGLRRLCANASERRGEASGACVLEIGRRGARLFVSGPNCLLSEIEVQSTADASAFNGQGLNLALARAAFEQLGAELRTMGQELVLEIPIALKQ